MMRETLRLELHDPIRQHGIRDVHDSGDIAAAYIVDAIGAGADRHGHIREAMVDLITITESFFA